MRRMPTSASWATATSWARSWRDITLTGNAAFHGAETLADSANNTPFTISRGREVQTAAEQAVDQGLFSGW
jgi:hypothetical protein